MTHPEPSSRLNLDDIDARLEAMGLGEGGNDDSDWDLDAVDDRWMPTAALEDRYAPAGAPSKPAGTHTACHGRVVPLRRSTSADAAILLPDLRCPNGYRRDRRGTWRYSTGGRSVPGARDVTVSTLHIWGRQRHPLVVRIPVAEARSHEELEWALDFWDPTGGCTVFMGTPPRHVQVIEVPRSEWETYASIPLGVDAPELLAQNMLSTLDVARLAGLSDKTITAYLAREQMPAPQLYAGRTPLWARPIIEQWLQRRG